MNSVNNPIHYNETEIEVIVITDSCELNFCLGNAVKYLLRCGLKHEDIVEDVKKAIWYLQHDLYVSILRHPPKHPITVRLAMYGRVLPREVENAMYILLIGLGQTNVSPEIYTSMATDCVSSAIIELRKINGIYNN